MDRRDVLLAESIGENLDALITLDLRGYGVPRILYRAARAPAGGPLVLEAARALVATLGAEQVALIGTGFIFPPWNTGELDGVVGAAAIARALEVGLLVKPAVVVEEELVPAISAVLRVAGLQPVTDPAHFQVRPHTVLVSAFPKDPALAGSAAARLLDLLQPQAMLAIERPGRSASDVYHMGNGVPVTDLAAKVDVLFEEVARRGGLTVAIGDLGNELGLGSLAPTVRRYVPFGERCQCPCQAGIAAAVAAQKVVVAAVSDWGGYALAAAIAFLAGRPEAFLEPDLERRLLERAVEVGLIDGSGYAIPAVDGVPLAYNVRLVDLLREVVQLPLRNRDRFVRMFDLVLAKRMAG